MFKTKGIDKGLDPLGDPQRGEVISDAEGKDASRIQCL
jgi:hypothetical protein